MIQRKSADLTVTVDYILGTGQLFQTHRAAGVHLLGGNADLGTQTELTAVGKAGGGIDIYCRTVHLRRKGGNGFTVF